VFWIKQEDNSYHKAQIDLSWNHTAKMKDEYRAGIKKLSIEKRLFTRRDKPHEDFRDLLKF